MNLETYGSRERTRAFMRLAAVGVIAIASAAFAWRRAPMDWFWWPLLFCMAEEAAVPLLSGAPWYRVVRGLGLAAGITALVGVTLALLRLQ